MSNIVTAAKNHFTRGWSLRWFRRTLRDVKGTQLKPDVARHSSVGSIRDAGSLEPLIMEAPKFLAEQGGYAKYKPQDYCINLPFSLAAEKLFSRKPRILVVEDKPSEREALAGLLKLERYEVEAADSTKQALTFLHEPIDPVISDLKTSKSSGLDLLWYWKEQRQETPFIMVPAFGEVDSAVQSMKLGSADYLKKPVDPEELLLLVAKC